VVAPLTRAPSYDSGVEIHTPRLVLRPFRPGDEESLAREADDRRVWGALRDRFPHPYRREDALAWIAANGGRNPPENLAITLREPGLPIGGVGVARRGDVGRFTGEIGYWLGSAHWRRGYATEAVGAFVEHAFAAFDFERLEAWVFSSNPASARVLEKCGFRLEGVGRRAVHKQGRFLDSHLYARLRDDLRPGGSD